MPGEEARKRLRQTAGILHVKQVTSVRQHDLRYVAEQCGTGYAAVCRTG